MSPPEPPTDDPPELQDPDFIQVAKALHAAAERARLEKPKPCESGAKSRPTKRSSTGSA